jgi:hypothetical protein
MGMAHGQMRRRTLCARTHGGRDLDAYPPSAARSFPERRRASTLAGVRITSVATCELAPARRAVAAPQRGQLQSPLAALRALHAVATEPDFAVVVVDD